MDRDDQLFEFEDEPAVGGRISETEILAHIREGMEVYNRDGDKVGTVSDVIFGTPGTTQEVDDHEVREDDSIIDMVADVFNPDDIPDTLRNRLLQHGFIRIDKGLLGGDVVAMPQDIAAVRDDNVILVGDGKDLLDLD